MLLDRIVIDAHGLLRRVELGPFSAQLNSVCGPPGSGKTAIARFICDSLIDREYPLGMFSSSSGRVVWSDRNGLLHCRREADGTALGRRSVELESRGDANHRFDSLQDSWMRGAGKSCEAHPTLPESIVDGVITDVTLTNVARVVAACAENGLDSYELRDRLNGDLDAQRRAHDERHRELREELRQVEQELKAVGELYPDHKTLAARKNQLLERLARSGGTAAARQGRDDLRYADLRRQLTQLHDQARRLRTRQNELRRWIDGHESSLDNGRAGTSYSRLAEDYLAELDRVTSQLDRCLGRAAELRRSMRSLQAANADWIDGDRHSWIDREAVVAEMRRIDECLKKTSRAEWLRSRHGQLLEQLGGATRSADRRSPLAVAASHWLGRLTAGRLQRVDWTTSRDQESCQLLSVQVDQRDNAQRALADRMLAAIAVRMAAGELLARCGRHVPLVLETQSALLQRAGRDTFAAAIAEYSDAGRQVIILTSDPALSSRLSDRGGRSFQIEAAPIMHTHRPLWRPQYQSEQYLGPHPHTYGEADAPQPTTGRLVDETPAWNPRRGAVPGRTDAEVNRELDVAWRELQMANAAPAASEDPRPAASPTVDPPDVRDGYFHAASYTNADRTAESFDDKPNIQPPAPRANSSPFLLSVDSPIDQAPSIDAVAAARLRGLDVTHIQHLMRQDPNRLADALGLTSVVAKTIRRWQAECRLVCRVPQLRGFDARILIACGIRTPARLAAIHPADLLKKVEAFLATRPGQRLLLSGSSHEIARITSWIAAANQAPQKAIVDRTQDDRQRIIQTMKQRDAAENERRRARVDRGDAERDRPRRQRRSAASKGSNGVRSKQSAAGGQGGNKRPAAAQPTLRFNLHRDSDVVDAPAIGPRMAARLNEIDIATVGDLLSADPESVASDLGHRRVDGDTVLAWQRQAALVCCVPMLRGHDAQLLVAADVTTAEQLAQCDAQELFEIVDEIAESREGRRIIRGGQPPDLAEVGDWIQCAQHQRKLIAA